MKKIIFVLTLLMGVSVGSLANAQPLPVKQFRGQNLGVQNPRLCRDLNYLMMNMHSLSRGASSRSRAFGQCFNRGFEWNIQYTNADYLGTELIYEATVFSSSIPVTQACDLFARILRDSRTYDGPVDAFCVGYNTVRVIARPNFR